MLTSPELVWLLAAVAKGDEVALERVYRATRPKLYGVVLRILRRADLADEVMQETYLRVWGSAGQFDPAVSSPVTWMLAVARDREHPGHRRGHCRVELAGGAPDPEIGFLHDLVGEVGPAQDTQHHPIEFRPGRPIHALQRDLVPLGDGGEEPHQFRRGQHSLRRPSPAADAGPQPIIVG